MLQSVKETVAYAVDMGFIAASPAAKQTFFWIIETAITNMTYPGLLDAIFQKDIDRWTRFGTDMNGLVEKMCGHPEFSE